MATAEKVHIASPPPPPLVAYSVMGTHHHCTSRVRAETGYSSTLTPSVQCLWNIGED